MSNDVHSSVNTDKLFSMLQTSGKSYDLEKIQKAYEYADKLHEGQFRNSGDPYISHPIAVAEIVASLGLDTDSICAAFLHDTIEDCSEKTSLAVLRKEFGQEIADIVDGLTKLVHIPFETKEDESIENLRKMFLAMSKDIRVIFINSPVFQRKSFHSTGRHFCSIPIGTFSENFIMSAEYF